MCDGVCGHSVSHAHFSDTFSLRGLQTSRTRVAQGVCSAHVAPLPSHLLPSHVSSTVFAVPARSPRHFVPVCNPKAGQAHFRMSAEESGYLADPTHSTRSSRRGERTQRSIGAHRHGPWVRLGSAKRRRTTAATIVSSGSKQTKRPGVLERRARHAGS